MPNKMSLEAAYLILGVTSTTPKAEIKTRYRQLAFECHPDRIQDDPTAAERFKEITNALETIEEKFKERPPENTPRNFEETVSGLVGDLLRRKTTVRTTRASSAPINKPQTQKDYNKATQRKRDGFLTLDDLRRLNATNVMPVRLRPNASMLEISYDYDLSSIKDDTKEETPKTLEKVLEERYVGVNESFKEAMDILFKDKPLQRVREAIAYASLFYGYHSKRETTSVVKITKLASVFCKAGSLEDMILAGSCVGATLADTSFEMTMLNGTKDDEIEQISRLYNLFLRDCKTKGEIPKADQLIKAADKHINKNLHIGEQVRSRVGLITEALSHKPIDIATAYLESTVYAKTRSNNGQQYRKAFARIDQLMKDKCLSDDEVLTIFRIVRKLDSNTHWHRLNVGTYSRLPILVEAFSSIMQREDYAVAEQFVRSLMWGSKSYKKLTFQESHKEVAEALQIGLQTYRTHPRLFEAAMDAFSELKLNSNNREVEWPGETNLTAEAASYGARQLVDKALNYENPEGYILRFKDLLKGFRESAYYFTDTRRAEAKKRNVGEEIEKTRIEDPIMHNIYSKLRAIKKGQNKKLLTDDVSEILSFYS